MKRFFFFTAVMMLAVKAFSQEAEERFRQLISLNGTWSMETKRGTVYESWEAVNNTFLKGRSYKINGTDTMLLEEVSIIRKDNDIFYIPVVQGQNNEQPVTFRLVKVENETFTFDNPDHDFPQRVIYQLPKNDSMHARIEGMDKGVYRKSEFFYKKVK